MKKILIGTTVFIVIGILSIVLIGRIFFPDNIAETSPDGEPKNLKTLYLEDEPGNVAKIVEEIVPTLTTYGSAWKIVAKTETGDSFVFKVEVPVVVFTDDLQITIQKPKDIELVSVDVRSQSRVGKSDFGENARHIRKFLAVLDEKLR